MDTNILSCAKCGHILSETAEACAYCGTVVTSVDSPSQPDAQAPGQTEQPVEPPPLPADDSLPVLDMTDELTTTPALSGEKSEAESSSQSQSEETRRIINESAANGEPSSEDPPSEMETLFDFQLPDDELIVEFGADETTKDPEPPSVADTVSAGIKKPELEPDTSSDQDKIVDLEQQAAEAVAEVIPLADKVAAKAATDDSPGLPQTPVLEVSGEDPSESETLGADILELVADEASEPETTQDQPTENITLADESAFEEKAEITPDLTPDGSVIKDGELEAIFLTSDDEVQSGTPSSPEDTEEAVKTEAPEKPVELAAATAEVAAKSEDSSAPGEAQAKTDAIQKQTEAHASLEAVKIEKAAQGLAEAQKKHKATSEATLLKTQKIARSKAQDLKIQKLKLAQAQALKRKKAALVKAQALKKQKEAQTGIEKANTETATGSTMAQSMGANTKMMGLLKKYEGQAIGINYDNSADIKEAELVEANDEFFSVFVKDQKLNYSHPLKTILTIIEGQDGVETGTAAQKVKFKAVVKVYPLVLF
jgi:hypothetical protein